MNKLKTYWLLIATIMMAGFSSCSSDDDTPEVPENKSLSKVIVKEHMKKFGEFDSYGELCEERDYNNQGLLTFKMTNYILRSDIGRVEYTYRFKYDEKNRLIEKDENELSHYIYKYTYNEIDSVSSMIKYDYKDGRKIEETRYEYGTDRKLKTMTVVDSWDFGYIHSYSYNGRTVTDVAVMYKDKSPFGTMVHEYDEHDNLLKETWTNDETGKSTVQKLNTYEYNSSGQMVKATLSGMFRDQKTFKAYTYNEDGTIKSTRISYSYKDTESELRYEYIY